MSQSESQLLRLPASVRQQIYEHLDILSEPIAKLEFAQHEGDIAIAHAGCGSGIYSLLLTCKLLYTELRDILYSRVHLAVRTFEYGDLDLLRKIRPETISHVTLFTIEPRTRCCIETDTCFAHSGISPMSPRAQLPSSRDDNYLITEKKLMKEWHALWYEHLQPNMIPGKAEMHFIFDASNINIARQASKPFWDGIPGMFASLSLRLSDIPDEQIQKLATLTVNKAAHQQKQGDVNQSFRFQDLPEELRDQILLHTDLVTPERSMWWSPIRKMAAVRTWSGLTDLPRPVSCTEKTSRFGCFCTSAHAAYTSNPAWACACWAPPTPLFLVSHAFRQQAMRIFYTYNELRILPQASRWHNFQFTEGDLPATLFLRTHMPRDGMQYLTKLEIVFPPWLPAYPETSFDESTKTWARWNDCIQAFRDMPLQGLTLRVVFATAYDDDDTHNELSAVVNEYAKQTMRDDGLYYDALLPLRDLPGLQHLVVELPHFRHSPEQLVLAEEALAKKVLRDRYVRPPQPLPSRREKR